MRESERDPVRLFTAILKALRRHLIHEGVLSAFDAGAHLDEPDVIKILTESLSNDTSWQVRRNAAQALERKCDPYSASFLANSLANFC